MNAKIRGWTAQGRAVRGRPLWVEEDGCVVLGNERGGIDRFDPRTAGLAALAPSPYSGARRILSRARLIARLLRTGARSFARLPSGTLLWAAAGRIWRLGRGESAPTAVFSFAQGSGPLFLAVDPGGTVTFGDYIATRVRWPSAIRRSTDDGCTWTVVHEFARDRIRHVHGAFWDRFSQKLWLTTGDAPHESALWILDGGVPVVVAGGQSIFRVVQPVFTAEAIYFGTDTPGDECGIYRMPRTTLEPQRICETEGPTFFGTQVNGVIAFTTVVEPGHHTARACLYTGTGGGAFRLALALPKDRWPMRLFQYGQIFIPANPYDGTRLWFCPRAVEGDGYLQSLELADG